MSLPRIQVPNVQVPPVVANAANAVAGAVGNAAANVGNTITGGARAVGNGAANVGAGIGRAAYNTLMTGAGAVLGYNRNANDVTPRIAVPFANGNAGLPPGQHRSGLRRTADAAGWLATAIAHQLSIVSLSDGTGRILGDVVSRNPAAAVAVNALNCALAGFAMIRHARELRNRTPQELDAIVNAHFGQNVTTTANGMPTPDRMDQINAMKRDQFGMMSLNMQYNLASLALNLGVLSGLIPKDSEAGQMAQVLSKSTTRNATYATMREVLQRLFPTKAGSGGANLTGAETNYCRAAYLVNQFGIGHMQTIALRWASGHPPALPGTNLEAWYLKMPQEHSAAKHAINDATLALVNSLGEAADALMWDFVGTNKARHQLLHQANGAQVPDADLRAVQLRPGIEMNLNGNALDRIRGQVLNTMQVRQGIYAMITVAAIGIDRLLDTLNLDPHSKDLVGNGLISAATALGYSVFIKDLQGMGTMNAIMARPLPGAQQLDGANDGASSAGSGTGSGTSGANSNASSVSLTDAQADALVNELLEYFLNMSDSGSELDPQEGPSGTKHPDDTEELEVVIDGEQPHDASSSAASSNSSLLNLYAQPDADEASTTPAAAQQASVAGDGDAATGPADKGKAKADSPPTSPKGKSAEPPASEKRTPAQKPSAEGWNPAWGKPTTSQLQRFNQNRRSEQPGTGSSAPTRLPDRAQPQAETRPASPPDSGSTTPVAQTPPRTPPRQASSDSLPKQPGPADQ